jgi:hypothetical protein
MNCPIIMSKFVGSSYTLGISINIGMGIKLASKCM